MKKIVKFILPLLLIGYLIFFRSFSSAKSGELLCNDLQIIMNDTLKSGFLEKKNIEEIILSEEKELLGYPISGINIRELEKLIRTLPYIKKTEIYHDLNGILYVKVLQREPVLKVLSKTGNVYYLDKEGYLFTPKGDFTPYLIVANGYFTEGKELKAIKNLSELSELEKYNEWLELIELINFIRQDEFWKSQLVQIYYNRNGEFELIPRVGAHQILLGNTDNLKLKFRNLKTLYEEGFAYEGWNKYEIINLKYNNQVICSKR